MADPTVASTVRAMRRAGAAGEPVPAEVAAAWAKVFMEQLYGMQKPVRYECRRRGSNDPWEEAEPGDVTRGRQRGADAAARPGRWQRRVTAPYQNESAARRGEGDQMTSTTERRAPNLLRLKEVITKTGLSKNTIYDRIRKKEFPAQIDLGGNCVAWSEDEIDRWIQAKMDARQVNEDGLPKAA